MSMTSTPAQKRETQERLKRHAEFKRKYIVTEYGVWHPDLGLVYTAPDRTMCNDHINSGLADTEIAEFSKKLRLVEISYHRPIEDK